jgi:phospholipid/cholesterol/gamma-HCH transport system substrate-binding protein
MSWRKLRRSVPFLFVLATIAVLGTAAAVVVLLDERLPNPFADTYDVSVQLSAANGVVPGYGQPVNVAGVPVGTISGARAEGGLAVITMAIRRSALPHVYRDATAALEPVTPLKDMELELSPGHPSAGRLGAGATIPLADSTSPGELEDLLGALDSDTRSFLASLITSLGTGTAGQGENMRRMLVALGPTAHQTGEITDALAARRAQIAQLVHNLSIVTRAASQDGRLAEVVQAGNATLHAVATQDAALRRSIAQLPGTLNSTGRALTDVSDIAHAAVPALTALTPAVQALPKTLQTLGPFAHTSAQALRTRVRPFVRDAQPALRDLAPAASELTALSPHITSITKVLQYATNELAYNPGGGDPGMLFWLDWAAHNVDSATGNEDAQGSIARTLILASCQQATSTESAGAILGELIGVKNACEQQGGLLPTSTAHKP